MNPQEGSEIDETVQAHIKRVLEVYGAETAYGLEQRTHMEDPWLLARGDTPPEKESSAEITHASMQDYFSQLADIKRI